MSQEPLETPVEHLGNAVDGCSAAPDGRHSPDFRTVTGHVLTLEDGTYIHVVDALCKYCKLSGSRVINPYSFNWD